MSWADELGIKLNFSTVIVLIYVHVFLTKQELSQANDRQVFSIIDPIIDINAVKHSACSAFAQIVLPWVEDRTYKVPQTYF